MCSCKHAGDVVADRQAGLVRALANQVSDDTTRAGDDVVAVALAGASPMSSASHGPTQADDLFQEQVRHADRPKFFRLIVVQQAHSPLQYGCSAGRWPPGGAGWLADHSQAPPEQPPAVGVGL